LKKPVKKPVKNGLIEVKGTKNVFTRHRKNNKRWYQRLIRLTDKKDQMMQENTSHFQSEVCVSSTA